MITGTTPEIFRSLDSNGDWVWGQGLSSFTAGAAAIALDVSTALKTFWGDAFWSTEFGVDWINLLGRTNSESLILAQTRNVIANINGVVTINSVGVNFNAAARVLTLTYNFTTIFSQSIINSVNVPLGS